MPKNCAITPEDPSTITIRQKDRQRKMRRKRLLLVKQHPGHGPISSSHSGSKGDPAERQVQAALSHQHNPAEGATTQRTLSAVVKGQLLSEAAQSQSLSRDSAGDVPSMGIATLSITDASPEIAKIEKMKEAGAASSVLGNNLGSSTAFQVHHDPMSLTDKMKLWSPNDAIRQAQTSNTNNTQFENMRNKNIERSEVMEKGKAPNPVAVARRPY